MNILHLVPDQKFIDFFARAAESVGGCTHEYIVHTPFPEQPIRSIRDISPFRKVGNDYFKSEVMQDDLSRCDAFFVHSLSPQAARMMKSSPEHVKVVWSGWGGDYYNLLPGGECALLESETGQIVTAMRSTQGINPLALARLVRNVCYRFYEREFLLMPGIQRADYFSSPIPEDYRLLKNSLGIKFPAVFAQLNYGSLEETYAVDLDIPAGKNILVGNSATPTNNHIEIFNMLKECDISDRKIIVPLSYGDSQYRDIILEYGRKIFGSNFYPVVNFVPLKEYNILIRSCSVVIMNHIRQQALGNIGSALNNGSKVFLNKKSTTFEFFRSRSAYVYSVDDILNFKEYAFSAISREQKLRNIDVLREFWGEERVKDNIAKLINRLKADIMHA